ncbi:MAG: 3-hydroxyacyl-CoA dehydrogenase [Burkholderiaceae bacterium]
MPVVAIIGSGLIGRAWAQVFARSDWTVRVWDPDDATRDGAAALISAGLHELATHGLVADPGRAAARVVIAETLEHAVEGSDFVQENGPEILEVKRATFERLDASAPRTAVLASSTSAIVASAFTEALAGRDRCLVGHPVNPPHLVPVVEVCGAPWTSAAARLRAREVYAAVGQVPIDVRREVDGFILNRLQGALLAEAFRLVGDGYCSPQDLDRTLSEGLGRRWSFMGPFATIELNAPGGIPDYCRRYTGFYRRLQADPAPETVWDEANWSRIVAEWAPPGGAGAGAGSSSRAGAGADADADADAGSGGGGGGGANANAGATEPVAATIAAKTRWRDHRLAALAAHLASQQGWEP